MGEAKGFRRDADGLQDIAAEQDGHVLDDWESMAVRAREPRLSCEASRRRRGRPGEGEATGVYRPCGPRITNQSPITSTSIFVLKKQSSASTGRHTTGSFSLKDVLSTIGTPVISRKASISCQ